jgi:hypothetical protein
MPGELTMTSTPTYSDILDQELGSVIAFYARHKSETASNTLVQMWKFALEEQERLAEAAQRERLQRLLDACVNAQGLVSVVVWQRDCDGVEGDHIALVQPTIEDYTALFESVADNAEGPFSLRIITPEQARDFRPYFRDTFAEAAGY